MTENREPGLDEMQRMAERALAELPDHLRQQTLDIVLRVTEFATREQLAAVDMDDEWELSGLYEGQPVPDQSVWESGRMPPRIWLFRQPILAEWEETGVDLDALVRHVVIHEAGHHFGFSDDDMHWLEDQAG
ncbi:metallopeptidase family protein [Qipengyuania sp.]|uniref:metallopeptidase family protein n=1 Tax=Qipengyuania sp. TaxID=2004515 RepID=UPI003736120E